MNICCKFFTHQWKGGQGHMTDGWLKGTPMNEFAQWNNVDLHLSCDLTNKITLSQKPNTNHWTVRNRFRLNDLQKTSRQNILGLGITAVLRNKAVCYNFTRSVWVIEIWRLGQGQM